MNYLKTHKQPLVGSLLLGGSIVAAVCLFYLGSGFAFPLGGFTFALVVGCFVVGIFLSVTAKWSN